MTDPTDWDSSRDPEGPRILEEAAEHLIRTTNRKPSASENQALEDWLARDPRHRRAWADVQRLWRGAGDVPEAKARAIEAKPITRRNLGKAVALLAAGGGATAWVLSGHPFADYRTGTGERRSITTADGSRIDLAAQTALSLSLDAAGRTVLLHEGQAFFRVATDVRPFTVAAGHGFTTALGTAFGVEYRGGEVNVAVTEHAVRVVLNAQVERVSAGSQVRYGPSGLGAGAPFDVDGEFAWREGRLVFADEPLGQVVAALNRWRGGTIVVLDRDLARRPITLIVDLDRSDAILDQLARVLPVRVTRVTPLLTILRPAN